MRFATATVLAAVAMFFWGFLFWAVSGVSESIMHTVPKQERLLAAIDEDVPESGVYLMPWVAQAELESEDVREAFFEQHRRGPIVQLFVKKQGFDPMDPTVMIVGFLHFLACAAFAGAAVALAARKGTGFFGRLGIVLGMAAFASLTRDASHPIWFHHDVSYWVMHAAYSLASWLIGGLILAAIIKPKPAPAQG